MKDVHPCALQSPLHDYLRDESIPEDIRQDRAALAPPPDCADPDTAYDRPMTQAARDALEWRRRMIEGWHP